MSIKSLSGLGPAVAVYLTALEPCIPEATKEYFAEDPSGKLKITSRFDPGN
jgi:hypothetical protein